MPPATPDTAALLPLALVVFTGFAILVGLDWAWGWWKRRRQRQP